MYCEKNGREMPERKRSSTRFKGIRGISKAAVAAAAVMIVLVLTSCGKKEPERFASPLEYYRYLESAAVENTVERLSGTDDGAQGEGSGSLGRRVDTEMTLELFKPAEDMLETYTGIDFSWLKTIGASAGVNFAEDSGAVELALSLNGRELIGMEWMLDVAEQTIYGRVPLLSKEYFQIGFDEMGFSVEDFDTLWQREDLSAALPDIDVQALPELLSRCVEAALERVGDVKQGSDTLTAGEVSAEYTTLTVTLSEEQLRDMAEDVCDILREDADLKDLILKLEELYDTALYDSFLDMLKDLPDQIALDDDVEMTLYVDEDDVIRGRVIEYDDFIFRAVRPEDGEDFGLEVSGERDGEMLWRVSGDGRRDDGTLEGTFTFTLEDTELCTVSIEDLDTERLDDGELIGTFTLRPTYEFYTYLDVYSLAARALEEFSYTLKAEESTAAFEVYMSGEPFLTLAARVESGPPEAPPAVGSATDLNRWAQSLLLGGGLENYLKHLAESDIPTGLLQQFLGSIF